MSSLPASTPRQEQEDEGISSSSAGGVITAAPAEERRCTRNDGKGLRCKKPLRMGEDEVYCEHHYLKRSASGKGRSKSRVRDRKKRAKKVGFQDNQENLGEAISMSSLPASTPRQEQEDEGISSSSAGGVITADPAEERRCTRNNGKGWRCKKPLRMGGDEVYCEHHYLKRSASGKGRSKSKVWDAKKRAKKAEPPLVLRKKKSPWLAIPPTSFADPFKFMSMEDDEIFTVNLQQIPVLGQVISSSYGFLVADDDTHILLLNPFTGAADCLPPFTFFKDGNNSTFDPTEIHGPIFSTSSSSTALIACVKEKKKNERLFFSANVNVEGSAWNVLDECTAHKCNIIIHKGKFYTVETQGSLISFDPAAGFDMTDHGFSARPVIDYESDSDFNCDFDDLLHLVEPIDGADLLLVQQKRMYESLTTLYFRVFKQDKDADTWARVMDLGDVAIFVGDSFSACIPTQGLPNLTANRVYFTLDMPFGEEYYDYGVFDLGTKTIDKINIGTRANWPPPLWIMP